MTAERAVSREVAPASTSVLSIDFLLASALIVAHLSYTWNVYHAYSKPAELQNLAWWLPVVGTVAYASMIYFGKKLMSSRRAQSPRSAMLLYNIYQSLINGFMAVWLVFSAWRAGFTFWGNYEDRTAAGYDVAFGLWMHYNNKYLELFDTLFMVLKKKDDQISFLHVYHHILLVWAWFVCILLCIGGDAYFGSAFNSLVHFFMYAYYALALFQIPCPWKKHLTLFQMIQFVCCASQSIYIIFVGKNVWWGVPALQLFVMLNMLVLFGRFYNKKYNSKAAPSNASKKTAATGVKATPTASFDFDSARETTQSPAPTFSTALVGEGGGGASPCPSPSPSPVVVPQEEEEQQVNKSTKKTSSKKKPRSKKAE